MNEFKNIFFIGIGGIGMSALARYFHSVGKSVYGYDRTNTELTRELKKIGMSIHYTDDVNNIPSSLTKENTLVVITPAIPKSHSEWNYFIDNGFEIKKRSEVLGLITKDTYCFAVAGTHGKTTTTAILGHILHQSGVDVTAFVGGIVENYHSNLIGNGKTVTVVEADEFDRSFLKLYPDMACVTSMDADHLDIYGDSSHIEDSFREFANKIQDKTKLFAPTDLSLNATKIGFSQSDSFQAENIRIENGAYVFDVHTTEETIKDIRFHLFGKHNLSNALMALSMAKTYGISDENIRKALESFKGIERRFSYKIKTDNLVLIDDYAHHPIEINAVYKAVKELYPTRKNLVIFQPHLFSRTRDFLEGFAESLSQFDEVILLDIYPARELPIEGITSGLLLEKINNSNKKLVSKQELDNEVLTSNAQIIAMVGAGDIGEMVMPLAKHLQIRKVTTSQSSKETKS
ncbi:UDP-N-acetylmuramate--L-alanine ligase [Avrilella dinanensis]|uniref:UDP-N-acetylmuramate--L-alanine ligase n=1 Tax=Avrilella dinanensis TaxID=2008672 RepID=UPI002409DBA6|nr:UDP-N-acetylmuramate--L-alanine ligase [Avrilella dinanensis]